MSVKKKVLLVGAGQMGALYDFDQPDPQFPKSHLSAFTFDSNFEISCIVEPDLKKIEIIKKKYPQISYVESLPADFKTYDVVVLANSTVSRYETLQKLVGYEGILFCEKPLALHLSEGQWIKDQWSNKLNKFVVNFSRRWDPSLTEISRSLKDGKFGAIRYVSCKYTKGFTNNGSHIVDYLHSCGFNFKSVSAKKSSLVADSFWEPTFSFNLEASTDFQKNLFPVEFTALNFQEYTAWEVDIWTEKGRVRLLKSGGEIEIYEATVDLQYPDYRILQLKEVKKGGMAQNLSNAVKEINQMLEDPKKLPACGLLDGLKVLKVTTAIKKSFDSGQAEAL